MKISEQFTHMGASLFRHRDFLALFVFPAFVLSFIGVRYPYGSHKLGLLWEVLCFLISLLGFSIRVITSGTVPRGSSGRSTTQPKTDVLNTTGIYSIVRHPLYLGNYLILLGLALFPRTWFLPIIASFGFVLCYERIIFLEESFLENRFGDEFRSWAARVPAIVPRFTNYRPAQLPFSFKAVLQKEFYGLFGIVGSFFGLDLIEDLAARGRIQMDPLWTPLFTMGLLSFLAVRALKKRRLLRPAERS